MSVIFMTTYKWISWKNKDEIHDDTNSKNMNIPMQHETWMMTVQRNNMEILWKIYANSEWKHYQNSKYDKSMALCKLLTQI
jgi:hypothetical protein